MVQDRHIFSIKGEEKVICTTSNDDIANEWLWLSQITTAFEFCSFGTGEAWQSKSNSRLTVAQVLAGWLVKI